MGKIKDKKNQKDNQGRSDYPIGYKKPPQHTQFKPGQSGNAKGRPKSLTTLSDVVRKQLTKTITINVGGKAEKGTFLKAIVMKQVSLAANGDHKSAGMLLDLYEKDGNDQSDPLREVVQGLLFRHEVHEAADRIATRPDETKADLKTVDAETGSEEKKS